MSKNGRTANSSIEIRKFWRPSKNTLQIMSGMNKSEVDLAFDEYRRTISPHMHIVQADFGSTIEGITEIVDLFTEEHDGRPPVVFLDYLQTVRTRASITDPRMITDSVIIGLKLISRKYQTPVITVSSFNRGANENEAEYGSFKESGMIEYSADVLLALQPAVLKTKREDFIKEKLAWVMRMKRREVLEEAEKKTPREMHLCILKNRYGSKWHKEGNEMKDYFDMIYYPDRDKFVERKTK